MSKFFESVEEEKAEQKKSVVERDLLEPEEKQSRKEKKLHGLRCRVMELGEEENQKKFDKELKKLFTEIRKAEHAFDGAMPPFLGKFLRSEKAYTKSHRKTIDELMGKYEKKEMAEAFEEERDQKAVRDELDMILEIRNAEERRRALLIFKDKAEDDCLKAKSLLVLLSMYVTSNDAEHILTIIEELGVCFRDSSPAGQMRKDFCENLEFYLTQAHGSSRYEEVLGKIRYLDESLVDKKMLELKYFGLNQAVETEDPKFRVLYYTRSGDYESARDQYEKTEFGEEPLDLAICREFGVAAFRNMDFELSFGLLTKCREKSLSLETKLLCVILNDRIRESKTFKRFLEEFRDFEVNRLCLASANQALEVYRSFYLLSMLDLEESASIIRKFVPSFDGRPWLSNFVESRINGSNARQSESST
jgi:hypothetical protein